MNQSAAHIQINS